MSGRAPTSAPQRVHRDLGLIRPLGLTRGGALFYALNLSLTDVFTVPLDAAGRVRGLPTPDARRFGGNNSAPDISPDGRELVYQVGLPGTGLDLVFQPLHGGAERVVHPRMQQFSRPRFDPYGGAVAVHGMSNDGIDGIFRVHTETGAASVLVADPPAALANPAWTRDGRRLFFERDDRAVWVLDRASGQSREIYSFSESASNFTSAPSGDGHHVAVVSGTALHVIDVARHSTHELLHVTAPERLHDFPGSLAWMPDEQTILFGKVTGDARTLWRIQADGSGLEPMNISAERQNIYFLRVSRDGRLLAFVMGDYDVRPLDVWVMENFLP